MHTHRLSIEHILFCCTYCSAGSGTACNLLEFAVVETDDPALYLYVAKRDYHGNILLIETLRSESSEFNFIMTIANFNEGFKITGYGNVRERCLPAVPVCAGFV